MKIMYLKVDEHARLKDEQIIDLIRKNRHLRRATKDFDELQKMVLDQEHTSTTYYENMCEEFQSFVDSITKLIIPYEALPTKLDQPLKYHV